MKKALDAFITTSNTFQYPQERCNKKEKYTIEELSEGFIGYKGASYERWNPEVYKEDAKNDTDWSGLYIAELEKITEGYLPDMVPGGNGTAYIHKVGINTKVNLITCYEDSFKTGNIDINTLKSELRNLGVGIQDGDFLMPKLGQLGYFFKCYNNEEGDFEIIIPNNMVDIVTMSQYKECEMQNYEIKGCFSV